jgi:hypothetical protein
MPMPGLLQSNFLTIKPATSKTPTITGSSSTALLQLSAASGVIVDGSNHQAALQKT